MSDEVAWEVVVGLEVHAQLSTKTKIFSRAPVGFGESPNALVNEVCAGMPGALPVLNRRAVELAVCAGVALSCDIRRRSVFARKNYFYPDLPKGYQISQFEEPICVGGKVPMMLEGESHTVALTRIHMEEDAGKSFHDTADAYSHIDLNRAGTPLIEIVSEPDIRSGHEAAEYLRHLREILVALGVNDGNMAEGSLRCDANVSVRPPGSDELRTRVEVKNLNSFRFLQQAVEYEAERQIHTYESGGSIEQETRLWDQSRDQTYSMRKKEGSADYRYFPDPDLPPLVIEQSWIDKMAAEIPELPAQSRNRLVEQHNVSAEDASTIVAQRGTLALFDACDDAGMEPSDTVRWLIGPLASALNNDQLQYVEGRLVTGHGELFEGEVLAALQRLVDDETINLGIAGDVLEHILVQGGEPAEVVRELGLEQVSDDTIIDDAIRDAAKEHPEEAEAFRGGKSKLMGFFMGQVMRRTGGAANPAIVRERIEAILRS